MVTSTALTTLEGRLLPRVTIQFCTQCKWMLRAAYFAQELLSTFGTSLGELALQPSTGGIFIVRLYNSSLASTDGGAVDSDGKSEFVEAKEYLIWDRKVEGGFPETKELKRRVRDIIDPKRDLGHVDGNKVKPNPPVSKPVEAPVSEEKVAVEEKGELLNSRGKIVISGDAGMDGTGGDFGYCQPGDEDCG